MRYKWDVKLVTRETATEWKKIIRSFFKIVGKSTKANKSSNVGRVARNASTVTIKYYAAMVWKQGKLLIKFRNQMDSWPSSRAGLNWSNEITAQMGLNQGKHRPVQLIQNTSWVWSSFHWNDDINDRLGLTQGKHQLAQLIQTQLGKHRLMKKEIERDVWFSVTWQSFAVRRMKFLLPHEHQLHKWSLSERS